MYLNEKKIKWLQIKNILLICFGVFEAFFSGSYIVSEFVMYRDNLYTAWHAKSMANSILFFTVGSILLVHALISRHRIGQATFFSSYFEGSLDGYVECSELAEVLGTKVDTVRKQLQFAKKHYMQKFELIEREGETIAELYSKKTLCQCRSCGAPMEMRIYFTGTCPYCKSSDLFAKILTDQRFYSISSDVEKGNQDASFYLSGGRKIQKVRKAIHKGDLINCTLEVHQKELVVALAKKIVKDKCPSCSGPIVGAVDENYVCNYCGKQIMGVVEKG